MTKTYEWTTPRGAKITATITVNHITRKTINADGHKVEVNCDEWTRSIDEMTINGKPTAMRKLHYEQNTDCILTGYCGKDRLLVALPADVVEDIYGEERRERAARQARSDAADREYEAHRNAILKLMNQ